MQLITDELKAAIPALFSTETDNIEARMVPVKFFAPWCGWIWYGLEGSEQDEDYLFYGYVEDIEHEFGYFTLSELERVSGPFGLKIERDFYWTPQAISETAKGRSA
jgi:hypothetical protein